MQKLVEVKRRMRTIEEIHDVARTLATVASAKLSRTRRQAAGMRLYAGRMREVLERQQAYLEAIGIPLVYASPLFVPHEPVERVALLHLSGDRGMCGNYNVAVNRRGLEFVEQQKDAGRDVVLVCRGAKGERYLTRRTDCPVLLAERWPRAGVTEECVERLHDLVLGLFLEGEVDEVWCSYTRFYTPIRRVPTLVRVLPIEPERGATGDWTVASLTPGSRPERWAYEPSFTAVVPELVDMFIRIHVEDLLLESFASEHGARMITMEEATERADKRLHECRVLHNRLRREFITTDLLGVLFASRLREEPEAARERPRIEVRS